jgi:hypothetical protein
VTGSFTARVVVTDATLTSGSQNVSLTVKQCP